MRGVRLVIVLGLVWGSGCGGAAPGAAPAPDTAADAEEAEYPAHQPGYGQPAAPAQKSVPSPAGTMSGETPESPAPLLPDRKLDTLDDALASLTEDQKLLDEALGEPIPTAELGLSACRRVCSAIGSMRRSANAICDLAGEDDPRCADARDTVEENERRVADAGCSC